MRKNFASKIPDFVLIFKREILWSFFLKCRKLCGESFVFFSSLIRSWKCNSNKINKILCVLFLKSLTNQCLIYYRQAQDAVVIVGPDQANIEEGEWDGQGESGQDGETFQEAQAIDSDAALNNVQNLNEQEIMRQMVAAMAEFEIKENQPIGAKQGSEANQEIYIQVDAILVENVRLFLE